MTKPISRQSPITIGLAIFIATCTWKASGKLTKIEETIRPIPEMVKHQARQDIAIARVQEQVGLLKHPLENAQANVKVLIRKVNHLDPHTAVVGFR